MKMKITFEPQNLLLEFSRRLEPLDLEVHGLEIQVDLLDSMDHHALVLQDLMDHPSLMDPHALIAPRGLIAQSDLIFEGVVEDG